MLWIWKMDTISLKLGQRNIEVESDSLRIDCELKSLADSKAASSAVVSKDGVDVVITDNRVTLVNPDFFQEIGVNLDQYDIVVLKGGYLAPRFKPFAAKVLFGLALGYTNQIFNELTYEKICHPIYPLDKEFDYNP